MKKYINLITSCVSLVVTGTLLIVVMFAWYVVNKEATATGIQASIVSRTNIVEEVNVYSFDNVTTVNNKSTYRICQPKDMRYNPDFDKSPTAKLIEITFVDPAVNLTKISANSTAGYFPGFPNQAQPGYVTSIDDLSLSSVVKYTIVENVSFSSNHTLSSGNVEFDTPSSFLSFSYNESNGAIDTPKIELIDTAKNNINSIYIFLDFNQESFERLYSNNIGNVLLDDIDELSYSRDFKFQILGSVVEI